MKRILILLTGICMAAAGYGQTDTTGNAKDTIRIGGMIIIKKKGENGNDNVIIHKRRHYQPKRVSTNWCIVDLGFANYTDNTDYSSAAVQQIAPGADADWFDLRNGKSVNVNIWIFMQRLSLVKNVVNLKYGLGLELNNYRYKSPVIFKTSPTMVIWDQSTNYSKNKLAADYVTVPLMLNFNFTPDRRNGFGLSVGVSAGYLYSSRQKTISGANGKAKVHDKFDLRNWKISYIAELQFGPVKLYGSIATQSMFKNAFDQTPYNFGLRLSNW